MKTKYENETFSVTKTRAEQQQVQAAEAAWRSRNYRQTLRRGILEDVEQELAWKKDKVREAKRKD